MNQKDTQPKTSSDGRAWSVGVDGGRKDGREFKLTKGEHLVRVTHERLKQRFFVTFCSSDVCCWEHLSFIRSVGYAEKMKTTTSKVSILRWYAGASFEFETNKGRVISFHPYLATK